MLICCIGIVIVKLLSSFTGLILYTKYKDCDPLTSKQISQNDQILPYYVMDVAGSIPGVPGIFIAGIFSAGLRYFFLTLHQRYTIYLNYIHNSPSIFFENINYYFFSTLSTTLNTLSFTIYEDFISPFVGEKTEKQKSNIMKLIAAITGILSTLLVFVVEHLGGILPLTVSFTSIAGGPLVGLFTLGLIFPMANAKVSCKYLFHYIFHKKSYYHEYFINILYNTKVTYFILWASAISIFSGRKYLRILIFILYFMSINF